MARTTLLRSQHSPRRTPISVPPFFIRRTRWTSILLAAVIASLVVASGPVEADDAKPLDTEIFGPPPPSPPAVIIRDDLGRVTLRATRLEEGLVLDGKLDDPIYSQVPAMSDFIQQEPHEGQPATEKTEAWVFFDDQNIYVSARCWDSHPERMVANEMRRDHFNIFQNENFTLVIDTFYDRRNGYYFQTNPLGAIRETAVTDEGASNNQDWNTVWDVKATIFEKGWMLEMAIPFKSLRFKGGREQIWGINLRRVVRWKNEMSYLAPVSAAHGNRAIYRFSDAATLTGIEVPGQSRNAEVKPYALASMITNNNADIPFSNDLDGAVGFDAKYGLTKGLTADFTYNTDFAQIEEDQQQVNLTRFSLFFPEKRDFFLEGQGIFSFGGVRRRGGGRFFRPGNSTANLTPIMFFSRQIGLTEDGIDPIQVGARVTGRSGRYRLGALNIQTEGVDTIAIPATNFSVFRLRRDVLRRSDIGVIATHRTTSLTEGATSNSLFGVDGNFAFYQNLRINGYYALSRTPLPGVLQSGDESSYLGRLDYAADRYGLQVEHLKVGGHFKPELGFLFRGAFRRSFVQGRFSPRATSIDAIRRFIFQGDFDTISDLNGRLETRVFKGLFRIEFENSDQAIAEFARNFEFLPEEFEISDGVILPIAEYNFQDVRLIYQFGPQRTLPGFVTFRKGSFFSGDRDEIAYNGRVEVSPQISIEPRLSLNWVNLPQGDFTARLVSARLNYTFSPRTFLSSFLQYNSSSDSFAASLRFRWEYQPGSDLFVVYSEGREDLSILPRLANRSFAVKFTKLFRF